MNPYGPPAAVPVPFWRSGGGIALIVVGGIAAMVALCVLGCFGMAIIGAATPSVTPTP